MIWNYNNKLLGRWAYSSAFSHCDFSSLHIASHHSYTITKQFQCYPDIRTLNECFDIFVSDCRFDYRIKVCWVVFPEWSKSKLCLKFIRALAKQSNVWRPLWDLYSAFIILATFVLQLHAASFQQVHLQSIIDVLGMPNSFIHSCSLGYNMVHGIL